MLLLNDHAARLMLEYKVGGPRVKKHSTGEIRANSNPRARKLHARFASAGKMV